MAFIISFDLDDLLIPGIKRFPVERNYLWHRLFSREKIRQGTISLIQALRARGCRIYIYTTSYRSPAYIRRLFFPYGIFPKKIINKTLHDKILGERAHRISKYPPAFNIDIHVDDAPGVGIEGECYHFPTIIIGEDDLHWVDTVLQRLSDHAAQQTDKGAKQ
ncbi:hypothetical protein [Chitinophaga sp. Ak27]|uniref:hypothetical protein n=1 Tax=Chitinophaga sp. Ak27 TaxID=2726116 RepID=UPI00145F0758|nr:hypothetical protein [Chitinophaga sp. Ak27]NLU95920.1 hypothetical protein [Chitinophaga sp. Ak27]